MQVMSSTHTLNSRQIDPKRAKSRPGQEPIKKIFVGGLDPDATEDDIRNAFGEYGSVCYMKKREKLILTRYSQS